MIGLELAHSTWDDAEIHAIEKVIKKNHYTMSTEVSECETALLIFLMSKGLSRVYQLLG